MARLAPMVRPSMRCLGAWQRPISLPIYVVVAVVARVDRVLDHNVTSCAPKERAMDRAYSNPGQQRKWFLADANP